MRVDGLCSSPSSSAVGARQHGGEVSHSKHSLAVVTEASVACVSYTPSGLLGGAKLQERAASRRAESAGVIEHVQRR